MRGFVVTTSWFLATWSYVVPDLEEIIGLSDNTCVVNKIPALVANIGTQLAICSLNGGVAGEFLVDIEIVAVRVDRTAA